MAARHNELGRRRVWIADRALLLSKARRGRNVAIGFLDRLQRTPFRIERVSEDDERSAVALIRAHDDKSYSFCDALSFVVMDRLGITDAIAFDQDFRSYGRFTVS